MSEPMSRPPRLVTETFIPGRTRTKGSMVARPNGTMVESVAGSSVWRRLMTKGITMDRKQRGLVVPEFGPVGVRACFYIDPPADVTPDDIVSGDAAPIRPRSGDLDKLARNLLDAMHDTRPARRRGSPDVDVTSEQTRKDVVGALRESYAINEDVQVVRLLLDKVYRAPGEPWGVFVQCWTMTPQAIRTQRELARAPFRRVMTKYGIV